MWTPQSIKPGETDASKKKILFEVYTSDGLLASGGADANYEATAPVYAAGDLKLSWDLGATWTNVVGTAPSIQGKSFKYTFDNTEVALAKLPAIAIGVKFAKTNFRDQEFYIPFRSEIEDYSFATDSIKGVAFDQNAIDKFALTLATGANLATVDGVVDAIKAKTDNLPSDPADASDIAGSFGSVSLGLTDIYAKVVNLPADPAGLTNLASAHGAGSWEGGATVPADLAALQADVDDIQSRLPDALVGGRMDSSIGNVQTVAAYGLQSAVALLTATAMSGTATSVSFRYQGQMNGLAPIDVTGDTFVGMTITLHNPNNLLTDGSAPQTRRILSGSYDGGTFTYTANVDAWTPEPSGVFGDDGGDYEVKLWPASTGLATQTSLDAVLLNQDILLGLLHHNSVVDLQTWSGTDLLTARIRRFASAAAAIAATRDAADDADGEIRRFRLVAEYASAGKYKRFQITEDDL